MNTPEALWEAFTEGQFDFTEHAAERDISEIEIREAGSRAITIEEYPDDKYGPTRLLLGFTEAGRALHIQIADSKSSVIRIIPLYEPDPEEWEDYERRK